MNSACLRTKLCVSKISLSYFWRKYNVNIWLIHRWYLTFVCLFSLRAGQKQKLDLGCCWKPSNLVNLPQNTRTSVFFSICGRSFPLATRVVTWSRDSTKKVWNGLNLHLIPRGAWCQTGVKCVVIWWSQLSSCRHWLGTGKLGSLFRTVLHLPNADNRFST